MKQHFLLLSLLSFSLTTFAGEADGGERLPYDDNIRVAQPLKEIPKPAFDPAAFLEDNKKLCTTLMAKKFEYRNNVLVDITTQYWPGPLVGAIVTLNPKVDTTENSIRAAAGFTVGTLWSLAWRYSEKATERTDFRGVVRTFEDTLTDPSYTAVLKHWDTKYNPTDISQICSSQEDVLRRMNHVKREDKSPIVTFADEDATTNQQIATLKGELDKLFAVKKWVDTQVPS